MKKCVLFFWLGGTVLAAAWIIAISDPGVAQGNDAQVNKDRLIVETLLRLKGYDLNSNPTAKAAVLRHVGRQRDQVEYVTLARHFKLVELAPKVVAIAMERVGTTEGAEAATLAVELGQLKEFRRLVEGKSTEKAARALMALGYVDRPEVRSYLEPLVTDPTVSRAIRNGAARAVGRSRVGEKSLLELARGGKLSDDVKFAVGNILLGSTDAGISREARQYFELPSGADAKPLPPLTELVKIKGAAESGRKLFETTASCAKCHKVRGKGKDVGPDLSEIGSKLSREALFVSILDPSAGISHNYETYLIELVNGNVLSGVLVSQTDQAVVLKTKEAIVKRVDRNEIELMRKSETSLMPADLVKTMTKSQLADIVAYLGSLRKQ